MRPQRVRQFPAPVQTPSFGRALKAANDNEPENAESVLGLMLGRSLLVGAALLAVLVVGGWSLWIGRALWRHFV
ncbi:hypothetical protein [uncultured Bosea sp.]|uniref:hypothetical protein n=1 Tax=uncultured Bosea sp. TaxID=211457 RepID=UPI0025DB39CA|nr:hypothetical protein [uncultured Bosea sp.]